MGNETYTRKEFICKCLAAGILFSEGALTLNACSKKTKNKKEASALPKSCSDLSGVSQNEIAKRKSLGYVTESTVVGSHCSNCKLYLPPTEGKKCGGCMLFEGPVEPGGYCTQYEPKS